jgi:hypothetical protein
MKEFETLKAWVHWKKKEKDLSEDDVLFVKDIEDLLSLVNTLRARYDGLSVHGSDVCLNCKTGRITIYAKSRWCLDCQSKKQMEEK